MSLDQSRMSIYNRYSRNRLEKLVLNQTAISSAGISHLTNLKSLQSLALSGTKVDATIISTLEQLPNLSDLYLWNTFSKQNKLEFLLTKIITKKFLKKP